MEKNTDKSMSGHYLEWKCHVTNDLISFFLITKSYSFFEWQLCHTLRATSVKFKMLTHLSMTKSGMYFLDRAPRRLVRASVRPFALKKIIMSFLVVHSQPWPRASLAGGIWSILYIHYQFRHPIGCGHSSRLDTIVCLNPLIWFALDPVF